MTPTQTKLLTAINEHWIEHGYGPTFRELQAATGTSSVSVISYRLARLITNGLVETEQMKARTIRLTDSGYEAVDAKQSR